MLEVHLANSLDAAAVSEPEFEIDFDLHSAFFKHARPSEGCPIIQRMRDYYSDCCISESELPNLIVEIDKIANKVPPNSPYQKMLSNFRRACLAGTQSGSSLFLVCD
ncbi:hypothetical protein N9Y42_11090 [Mariniblastus sp.]|nr:hypothetical protein [Mariniblastus sp.]